MRALLWTVCVLRAAALVASEPAPPVGPEAGTVVFGSAEAGQGQLAPANGRTLEQMKARLSDPEQRRAIRAEQRASIEHSHADVAEELGIDAAARERLLELLTDYHMRQLDLFFTAPRGPAADGAQAGYMQAHVDLENARLDALRKLFGEDGLERYRDYSGSQAERMAVRTVEARLTAGDALQPEQQARLRALFREYHERERPPRPTLTRNAPPRSLPGERQSLEQRRRAHQLEAIAMQEEHWRGKVAADRWLTERAATFLSESQVATLTQMHAEIANDYQRRIETARERAGLDRAIPEAGDAAASAQKAAPVPVAGKLDMEFVISVNGARPVVVRRKGPNGQAVTFEVADGLSLEATPTFYERDYLTVQILYYEERPTGRRLLSQSGTSTGVMRRISDGALVPVSIGSTVVVGRKAYAVDGTLRVAVE